MIISFAYTTGALLQGRKTVTRRAWKDSTFAIWCRAFDMDRFEHDAYDKLPSAGGHKVGTIRMTCRPYKERLKDMPAADVKAEGTGRYLTSGYDFADLFFDSQYDKKVVVVRFILIQGET